MLLVQKEEEEEVRTGSDVFWVFFVQVCNGWRRSMSDSEGSLLPSTTQI